MNAYSEIEDAAVAWAFKRAPQLSLAEIALTTTALQAFIVARHSEKHTVALAGDICTKLERVARQLEDDAK